MGLGTDVDGHHLEILTATNSGFPSASEHPALVPVVVWISFGRKRTLYHLGCINCEEKNA